MKPERSLKARALQLLAQREQSRAELRRKLLAHAKAEAARRETGIDESSSMGAGAAPVDIESTVEATLDWLEAHNYLSQERFVESRVHARAARFGNLRIRQELAQHAVTLSPEAAQALKTSELERARAVWSRRFGEAAADPAGRARQMRFLAARGFSSDVVRQLLRAARVAAGVSRGAGEADTDDE